MTAADASMSDARRRQQPISEMVDTFVNLSVDDALQITVCGVTIECHVHHVDRTDSRFTLLLATFADDYLRIETQWANGWLNPQVDRLKPVAEERQPLGELDAVTSSTPSRA